MAGCCAPPAAGRVRGSLVGVNRAQRRSAAREARRHGPPSPKVCVATLYRADEPPVGAFFDAWTNMLATRPVDIVDVVGISGALVDDARNGIVERFLTGSADYLWTCDSDMDPDADTVARLLAHADPVDRPIVGALCFRVYRNGLVEPTLWQLETEPHEFLRVQREWEPGSLVRVAATGAACLLVHRSVFEKLPAPWFGPGSLCGEPLGEDITFALAAGNAGFPIHVATDVAVGHVKPRSYGVADWARQRAEQARIPTFCVIPVRDMGDPVPLPGELPPNIAGWASFANFEDGSTNTPRKWNKGLAWAREQAAEHGIDEFNVAFLNDDLVFDAELTVAQLSEALRADPAHELAYPNWHGLGGSGWVSTQADDPGGLTHSGWCFMVRGESAESFDERFAWWFADNDYEIRIRRRHRKVVCALDAKVDHLHGNESTAMSPVLQAQAERDKALFCEVYNVDPRAFDLVLTASRSL